MNQPGWYHDPEDPSQLRLWDGSAWTDETRPAKPAPPAPTEEAASLGDRVVGTPASARRRWVVGLAGLALLLVGTISVAVVTSSSSSEPRAGSNPSSDGTATSVVGGDRNESSQRTSTTAMLPTTSATVNTTVPPPPPSTPAEPRYPTPEEAIRAWYEASFAGTGGVFVGECSAAVARAEFGACWDYSAGGNDTPPEYTGYLLAYVNSSYDGRIDLRSDEFGFWVVSYTPFPPLGER